MDDINYCRDVFRAQPRIVKDDAALCDRSSAKRSGRGRRATAGARAVIIVCHC